MPGCAFCYTQNKHHPISSRMRKWGRDQSGTITQHLFWSSVASPPLICICPLRTHMLERHNHEEEEEEEEKEEEEEEEEEDIISSKPR